MRVLDRSIALVEAAAGGGGSVGELARITGMSRSTAFRLLNALVRQGMLSRDDSGVYRLGGRAFRLGALADQELLLGLAARAVELLHAATGESVHVYRRVGTARECVAGANKLSGLRSVVRVGHLEEACGDAVDMVLDARHDRRPAVAPGPGWEMTTRAHVTCLAAPVTLRPGGAPALAVAVSGGPDLALRADGVGRRLCAAVSMVEAGLRAQAFGVAER